MCDCLTKTEIELMIEDKIHELIKENVTIEISRDYDYGLLPDQMKLEVEIWYGNEKIDSDYVTVKD